MKTRILSYLLVFSMILALLPASALAEGESTTTPHITATVKHAFDSSGAETGQDYSANRSLSDGYEKPIPHR